MKRSDFIKMSSLASCGLFLPNFNLPILSQQDKKKILIIGAGAAGAMAAKVLLQNGHEVIVLEARNRVGGRINTNKDWGMSLELGANWISEASNPKNIVANLKEEVGLYTESTSYSKVKIFDHDGSKISKVCAGITGMRTENKVQHLFENENITKSDTSWGHAVDSATNYDNCSEAKKARIDIIKLGNSVSAGADSYKVSGLGYGTYDSDEKVDEQLVLNGYKRIIEHLLRGVDVRLGQRAIEIKNLRDKVEITTDKEVFSADYVIVTVPISLLQQKKIRFSPELPAFKQQSFHSMPMGLFNKVFMEFSDKFWKGNPHFFAFRKEVLKNSGIVFNYHAYSKKPILVAFHVGESGKWLESSSTSEIKKHWQETFFKAYPNKDIEFKRIITSKWLQDPFALGSYSSIGIGTSPEDVKAIAAPVGRIHFAGEATDYLGHGYVHGAMKTGLREAKRILEY